ncbi:MAG: glycosyltransferase family 2 protein [Bacteroidota bacterium]
MTKPQVSICIPTYNGDKYLRECLNSCVDQLFKDYEIIISDDCSSDKTLSIIEEYVSKYPSIKFYKGEQNLGLVGNWNRCLELSSGKWIKFVFQDDYITNDCLQKFVDQIDEHTQLVVCKRHFILPENAGLDVVNYYTNVVRTLENTSDSKANVFPPQLISKIAIENMCMNFIGEPSLIFFKKSVVNELGPFNFSLKQICDLEFALKIASKYGLKYVPEKLCAFRIHGESTTSNNVDSKYYELHYIEPLLFSYELLYSQNFAAFRSNLNFSQRFKLKLYFKLKAYKAYSMNNKEERKHYLFSENNTEHRKILEYKKGNIWIRLLAAIR